MKEDWTKKLRQRLDGHKAEPPAGLWEGLSKQMGFKAKPVHNFSVAKRWYWAVAAAVLALVGFFAYQIQEESNVEKPLQAEISKLPVAPQETAIIEKALKNEALSPMHTTQPQKPALLALTEKSVPTTTELAHREQVDGADVSDEPSTVEPEEDSTKASQENLQAANVIIQRDDRSIEQHRSAGQQQWSVGLNVTGGLFAMQSTEQTERAYPMASEINTWGGHNSIINGDAFTQYANTNIVAKHRLPVRLGLSFQYKLNDHLALLSGLNYTYLYSEFSIPFFQNISYTQKLHYLGIPVGIAWKFWSSAHLSFYLSGQTMLEKCLNDKPWQWSLGVSAGAEYSIVRQLGLYLEPSLSYFFDDGTSLEHYYKEHPLAPSIELGLRLHLNQ